MPVAADIYYHIYEGGEEGRKPSVVLIHGAGGNHLYWPSEVRRLSNQRIYAVDLPGHGKSAGRGHQSIAGYAGSLVEWLEAVGLHSAVFVGHSMGSAIALTLALDHPSQVRGLGLVGGAARLRVNPALIEATANAATFHTAVEMAVSWSFGPASPPGLVEMAARRMAETRPSVLHGDFLACDAFDVTERVPELRGPLLAVCGAEDRMTPLRNSQFLAGAVPGGRVEIVPGAGHMVQLEQPPVVAAAIARFLDEIAF